MGISHSCVKDGISQKGSRFAPSSLGDKSDMGHDMAWDIENVKALALKFQAVALGHG